MQENRERAYGTISLLQCAKWDGGFSYRRDTEIPCPQRTAATSKDHYGRTLATVMLPDGLNLNKELVKQGWCWWYRSMLLGMRPISRSSARRYVSVRARESRRPKSRRAGSWRRSVFPDVPPQCIRELRVTLWTIGMRERVIGQLHAMGLPIRPLCDPVLTISRSSGLLTNVSADTTDVKQRRCDARCSQRSGRRLPNSLHD